MARRKNDTTTYDIADKAGVNQSTVSRVLSGHPGIPDATVQKVLGVCRKLNYVPNAMARALRTKKAYAIAVHIPFTAETVFGNPFVPAFLRGVRSQAARWGRSVLLSYPDPDDPSLDLVDLVRSKRADGVIVTSPHIDDERIGLLREHNVPMAVGRCTQDIGSQAVSVDIDNRHMGYQAAMFLLSRGHRRIAIVCASDDTVVSGDVCDGFQMAVSDAGIDTSDVVVRFIADSASAGMRAVTELCDLPDAPTAVMASTAWFTFGAIEAVRQCGSEMVIVGVGSSLLTELHPQIAHVDAPIEQLGSEMAGALMRFVDEDQRCDPVRLYSRIIDENGQEFTCLPPASTGRM